MEFFRKYSTIQKNVFFSITQVLINGISLFFAYRFAISSVGIDVFGVWAIINSFASFLSATNFGMSGAFIRYIPNYIVEGRSNEIAPLIFTNITFFVLFGTLLGIIFYFTGDFVLPLVIDFKYILIASSLFKLSIIVFVINVAVGLFSSIIDGYNLIYKRNIIQIIASIFFLLIGYFCIKTWGIIGMVLGQLIQGIISLLLLILLCHHIIQGKYFWNYKYLKETISYGFQSQIISLMQIGYEPIIKVLLGRYSGVTFVSYFELSNKVVLQTRGIIVNAFLYLIPRFASIKNNDELSNLYRVEFKKVRKISFVVFSTLIIFSPIVSIFFLKKIDLQYISIIIIVALSWAINTISTPAYYFNMGRGILSTNIKTHGIFILTNIILSILLSTFIIDFGVILGMFFSNLLSTFYILREHSKVALF